MRYGLVLFLTAAGWAAGPATATITGRVFDVYHRPVRQARVATMRRQPSSGHLVPATPVTVDDAGMYRLSLPPGQYVLAALPPPHALDFATVFPAFFQDTVKFEEARPIDLRPGELRPFTDFLLLEVESHHLSGAVTNLPKTTRAIAVILSAPAGYTDPLQIVAADTSGHFQFDRVPAGTYTLKACVPLSNTGGLSTLCGSGPSGRIQIQVRRPEITGIQIQLRSRTR